MVIVLAYSLNQSLWKRFFSAPCALVDNYLKLADGPALKLILYLLSCEGSPDDQKIIAATGLSAEQLEEAAMFWRQLGVMTDSGQEAPLQLAEKPTLPSPEQPSGETPKKVLHSRFSPKDIADMLGADSDLKELFSEAESTLGRTLKHADFETLISLRDYYGFSEQAIVLILSHCADLEKTSAKYYETVAKSLFESGNTDFHSIEAEFERLREQNSFESRIKRDFGLNVKLSKRQSSYIASWKEMGFGEEMISLAREKCLDSTNGLAFAYIDKILKSWHEKGYFTPEAAEADVKPQKQTDGGFDWDEFDKFTLGLTEKEKK